MDMQRMVRQFRQEYADVSAERDRLDARLSTLAKIIEGLTEYADVTQSETPRAEAATRQASPIRESIMWVLRQRPGARLTTDEVFDSLKQAERAPAGSAPDAVIRKNLSRMAAENVIGKAALNGRSNVYFLEDDSLDTSAVAASAATAEDGETTTGKGGEPHAQIDQGDRPDQEEWNGRDRGGDSPSLGEVSA